MFSRKLQLYYISYQMQEGPRWQANGERGRERHLRVVLHRWRGEDRRVNDGSEGRKPVLWNID